MTFKKKYTIKKNKVNTSLSPEVHSGAVIGNN